MQSEYRKLLDQYLEAIREFFGGRLASVAVFGSVARGTADKESDIDVLVIVENLPRDIGLRYRETATVYASVRNREAYKELRQAGRSGFISEIFLTPDETRSHPPILLGVCDDGILLYDRGGFLEGVLNDIRARLRELNAKKVTTPKGYYWVLKPDAKPLEVVEV